MGLRGSDAVDPSLPYLSDEGGGERRAVRHRLTLENAHPVASWMPLLRVGDALPTSSRRSITCIWTPENSAIGTFPARKTPILTVKSGAVVKIDTGGGAG